MNPESFQPFNYSYRKSGRFPKRRGVMRKARKIFERAAEHSFEISPSDWFYYSHVHLDWNGIGNLGPRIRLLLLEAHCQVYRAQARAVLAADFPCHLFLVMDITDAGRNCVMIHSPNPYSDFPCGGFHLSERVPFLEELLSSFPSFHNLEVGGSGRSALP
jgi:hypothetical protein